jgi:predicted DNA-binding transcriptional regulator AlpA
VGQMTAPEFHERRRLHLVTDAATGPEPLLTAAEVAKILAIRTKRVYELGIPAVRLSEKCLRWRRSAVDVWLESRTEGGSR